jgi:hypothetical protein
MRKLIATVSFLLSVSVLFAQRFGGTPPSVKWKQINTDTARVVFSEGLDSQAQRVATLVHYQASYPAMSSLGDQLKKINIVLQNQTTVANGYVGLGPYRSEFLLTPMPNNFDQGSLSWIDQLSIHEYRHVQQFNNFNHGISKLMSALFGEEGYALATNASVPDWFFEGDAVYNETVLSPQGRGRLPLFMNAYPSMWKVGKNYSWMKLRNGSLKDYVPGHYNLGYLLVNYGYEKYGADFWSKVTKDASAFKGLFYPFQKAIRKHAGVDYQSFRNAALDKYKKLSSDMQLNGASQQKLNQGTEAGNTYLFPVNKKYVTNYLFPYAISPDSLLYLKTSYRRRPAFYIKDSKGELRLRVKDISIDEQFSYRNGKVVYAAYENDARWSWRDYSVIKILDIHTGQQQTITHKSKYFSPDISASGTQVAAVQIDVHGKSELHILDAASGKIKNRISNRDVNLYTDPKFINEDSLIAAVRLKDGKMALALIDLGGGNAIRLTPPSYNVVGYPSINNDGVVYFTASYDGSDNIFALKLDEKKIYQVSEGTMGHYFVNAAGDKITYSVFTAEGYQLQQKNSKPLGAAFISISDAGKLNEVYPVSHSSAIAPIVYGNITTRDFDVSKYRKGTRLINFHSWRPYYEDPEFTFSLYGQNVLNTLETELYYLYNQNDKTNAVGFNTVYGGWFPYLSAGTQYTFNRQQAVDSANRQWDQLDTRVGISLPLSFTSGRTFKNFSAGTDYVFRSDRIKGPAKLDFDNTNFSYLSHRIAFSEQVQSAVQHIYPRFGYAVSAQYRHAINKHESWQFLGGASLYLPGVLSTHNLVLTGAFQLRDTVDILFGDRFAYSRGFNEAYLSKMWRASANYHFPLIYPDWGFANILYFPRIRANAFFDFTRVYSNNKAFNLDQRSAGGEIYIDTKWWNQYELTFGFRVSRLLDDDLFTGAKGTVFEFILPVSILPR